MRTVTVLALATAVAAVVVRPRHTTAYPSGVGYVVVGWTRQPNASLQCQQCFGTGDTDGRPDEACVCTCAHAPVDSEQLQTLVSGVSVCVPPLYGGVDMRALNAWVSWYEGAGAGTFFMYTMNDVVEVLSPKGAATRVHMVSVPWMAHKNVWQRGQLWSIHDCLHRVRAGGGRWALFIDVDEYLVAPAKLAELTSFFFFFFKRNEAARQRNDRQSQSAWRWQPGAQGHNPRAGGRCRGSRRGGEGQVVALATGSYSKVPLYVGAAAAFSAWQLPADVDVSFSFAFCCVW